MENNEQKRGRGRPKAETYLDPEWYNIIIQSGKEGKHITDFLITLGICWDTHHALLKRNKKYLEAVNEYLKLCENYWYELGLNSMNKDGGKNFNSRLWSLVVRNKFPNNWSDSTKVDLTTNGKDIKEDKTIQVEIVRKVIDEKTNNDREIS